MSFDPEEHHRRSIRIKGYDYSQPGAYFVTICARDRECLLGSVLRLNEFGEIAQRCWEEIPGHFPSVELDAFVVMPNHIHAILVVLGRGTACRAPTTEQFGRPIVGSIPTIVRTYKSAATRRINALRATAGVSVWQRNYYEHLIRTQRELQSIREYILGNPAHWSEDRDNPAMTKPACDPGDQSLL
jgi:REP element-mobilizing transposase RayT